MRSNSLFLFRVLAVCVLPAFFLATFQRLSVQGAYLQRQQAPIPPVPEPIIIVELPLPPVARNSSVGSCSIGINLHGTGCIGKITGPGSGNFLPDSGHVVASINFTGAPAAPDPRSIYSGLQLIVVKADNTTFPNGDPWKCITCGIPAANQVGRVDLMDYPQAFSDGTCALAGPRIIDCGSFQLSSTKYTPNATYIYPIRWNTSPSGTGVGGPIPELRLHPDDNHLGFNSMVIDNEFSVSQTAYIGRLGSELKINQSVISVGEPRGFSRSGQEVAYIGSPSESCNIDVYAIHLITGKIRRLTAHPEYVDPVDISPDDAWTVMWLSGMRGTPPIIDMIVTRATSYTRNNGERRFFQPWLIDRYGDRGQYYGQHINVAGDGSPGSINDAEWNGRADPKWSFDGTRIVYYQAQTVSPECGEKNPLPCYNSIVQGGRQERMMLVTFTSHKPYIRPALAPFSDIIPWSKLYVLGATTHIPGGNYTLRGQVSGTAEVIIIENAGTTSIETIAVTYCDFSDDGANTLSGCERVDWFSDIVQTGVTYGTITTSPGGMHVSVNIFKNLAAFTDNLTTTLDSKAWYQPANGT
ncbi:hypothetical protein B0O99DRAFT_701805 [Bisporella sp. PMI_857]|nr:hypothetical protein B0O99DRAFT_701805 [Bisporella sp. PMI_857]